MLYILKLNSSFNPLTLVFLNNRIFLIQHFCFALFCANGCCTAFRAWRVFLLRVELHYIVDIFTFCCAAVATSLICLAFYKKKEPLRIVEDYIWMFYRLSQLTRAAPPFLLSIVLPDCNCGAELEVFKSSLTNTYKHFSSLQLRWITTPRVTYNGCSQRREWSDEFGAEGSSFFHVLCLSFIKWSFLHMPKHFLTLHSTADFSRMLQRIVTYTQLTGKRLKKRQKKNTSSLTELDLSVCEILIHKRACVRQ